MIDGYLALMAIIWATPMFFTLLKPQRKTLSLITVALLIVFSLWRIFDKKEFNSGNDTLAVEVLLNTEGLDFDVMTATTCQHLVFDREAVEMQLRGKSEIGDYLLERWETYERWWTKEDPEKQKWIMWDVAIIEALARPELAMKDVFQTPMENTPRKIEAYVSIDVEAMINDFWDTFER